MASVTSLVYYAAVSKGSVVVAEYVAQGNMNLCAIATQYLEHIPPLHSTFSHTTKQGRFICIIDGVFTYCAIIDEALNKADAFSYLKKNRDALRTVQKGRGLDSETFMLNAHFLKEEMVPIMRQHAVLFVGLSQRDKQRMEAEQDTEICPEGSLPTTAGVPSDEEFHGYCCWQVWQWLKCLFETR